jgi:hypothetical protein
MTDEITVINISPRESECAVCRTRLIECRRGIPFYEGRPVSCDWKGDWVGRDACDRCFEFYESLQRKVSND